MKNYIISQLLSSKKIWLGISSILIPMIASWLSVDDETVAKIWYSCLAMLFGQSLADLGKEAKKKK
tara:strand:- start:664 stop:861 length:198 start_codon:yes stop_codon:yes gene_type:complete